MDYQKTIKDTYADAVTVEAGHGDHESHDIGSVYMTPEDGVDNFSYTPSQARALAKALKQAANVAEGKPAKAPKEPAEFIDNGGDSWERQENGLYRLRVDNSGRLCHDQRTYDYVRQHYGIANDAAKGNA